MSKDPFKVGEPDLSGSYTASDYLKWQLDELVELIRGKVYRMSPAPSSFHQKISIQLLDQMLPYFRNQNCQIFHAPFDVYLVNPGENYKEAKNVVEPDLCVICDLNKIKKFGCVGTPDLIIEILSPSTSQKDKKDKFELYEEFSVREYWMVAPESRSVSVSVLEGDVYETFRPLTANETLASQIFPGLAIDLSAVFREAKG